MHDILMFAAGFIIGVICSIGITLYIITSKKDYYSEEHKKNYKS